MVTRSIAPTLISGLVDYRTFDYFEKLCKFLMNLISDFNATDFEGFKTIDLSGNNFESVPKAIRSLKDVEALKFSNNPIRNINGELLW